jgi:hypothetical protein
MERQATVVTVKPQSTQSVNPKSIDDMTPSERISAQLNDEFAVLNICDVMDVIYAEAGKQYWETTYAWECKKVKEFCKKFGVYLYEKPKENFDKWEGIEEATKGGYRGVILSNLS